MRFRAAELNICGVDVENGDKSLIGSKSVLANKFQVLTGQHSSRIVISVQNYK